jgi:hypothetical protein
LNADGAGELQGVALMGCAFAPCRLRAGGSQIQGLQGAEDPGEVAMRGLSLLTSNAGRSASICRSWAELRLRASVPSTMTVATAHKNVAGSHSKSAINHFLPAPPRTSNIAMAAESSKPPPANQGRRPAKDSTPWACAHMGSDKANAIAGSHGARHVPVPEVLFMRHSRPVCTSIAGQL